jgi:hypothetical protein
LLTQDLKDGGEQWNKQAAQARTGLKVGPNQIIWVDDHVLESVPRTQRCFETVQISQFWAKNYAFENGLTLSDVIKDHHCDPGLCNSRNLQQFESKIVGNLGQKTYQYSHFHDRVYDFEDFGDDCDDYRDSDDAN